jgi:PKD repeat protein
MLTRRRHGRARLAIATVLGLLATLVVMVAAPPAGVVQAVPAPTSPLPSCVYDENDNAGLGCAPGELGGIAAGTFASDSSFVIDAGEIGFAPCASYVSTGCYYEVYSPSIVRCVYLYDNDPTDVRSCSGSFSTSGSVGTYSAQRQGSCRGELGSTYAAGGPTENTFWTVRGPVAARCEFYIDTVDIDRLAGPTFLLASASVDECIEPGNGYGCDEYWATLERHTRYGWIPVEGDLAPRASFEPDQLGNSLSYRMDNTSIPFDGPTTYEWDFGDGSAVVQGSEPTHVYDELGNYRVTLTMRGAQEGQVLTASEWIDIAAPDLRLTVSNPDAEFGPGKDGNRYDIGDEFDVRVHLEVTDGVGNLRQAAPVDNLLSLPAQFEFVGTPPNLSPKTYEVGDTDEFEVRVRAVAAGRATIRSVWNANDILGDPAGPWTGSFETSVNGLQVTIEADPDSSKLEDTNDDGIIDENDENFVDVDVTVKNVTEQPITDVGKGPLIVTSQTDDLFVQFIEIAAPVDDPGTTPDESNFGDLAPDEEKTLTWSYRADEQLKVELSMLVTGNAAGATVTGRGTETVKVVDQVMLEVRIDVVESQSFRSGAPVRINGNFTNVTDDADEPETISFVIGPSYGPAFEGTSYELNAGGGFFGAGGASATGITAFELAPGASIDLVAVAETIEATVSSGFRVEYNALVSVKEVAEGGAVSWTPMDEFVIDFIDDDGFDRKHDVTLGRVPEPEQEPTNFITCDEDLLWAAEYVGCKLVRGVETAARGFGSLAQIAWTLAKAPAAAYGWMLGTTFAYLESDSAARQAIVSEIVAEMEAMWHAGVEAVRNVSLAQLGAMVGEAIDSAITRLVAAWERGATAFLGEVAEIAGENIDMVFEALVAARAVAKVSRAVAAGEGPIRTKLQQAWAERANKAFDEVDDVIASKGHRAVPESNVMPAGLDVTTHARIWRDSYGLSADNFRMLAAISKEYAVNIMFRSRSPKSIQLIEDGIALPKPQGIKAKGVNEIDMDFLDYPRKYDSKVVHMEPPIPFIPDAGAQRRAAERYADRVLAEKRPGLSPGTPEYDDLRGQIASRVETRVEEWVKLGPEYKKALSPPIDPKTGQPIPGADPVGVKVDFDPEFNGVQNGTMRHEPNRPIELKEAESVNGRALFEVKLFDPDTDRFLDVTGDIDFVAILKPDGKVLGANGDPAELAKRLEVYEAMRSLVGMQHGESFTIFDREKLRRKFLSAHVDAPGKETMLAMTPQQRLVTTYFDDNLSTLKGGPSAQLGELQQAQAFFRGVFTELGSPNRPWSALLLEELARVRRRLVERIPTLFSLATLRQIVRELDGTELETSRDAPALRPTDDGNLEMYQADGGGAESFAPIDAEAATSDSTIEVVSPAAEPAAATDDAVIDALDQIIADLEAAGADYSVPAGALGGRWVPVELDDVVVDDTLSMAPFGYLLSSAEPGSTGLDLTTRQNLSHAVGSAYFEVGDEIILDPGGVDEERATIVSLDPVTLAAPIQNFHGDLTEVILATSAVVGDAALFPLTPARVFETRTGEVTVDGEHQAVGRLEAGSVTKVQIAGRGGVSSGAAAVALNVTAIRPSGVGYVTLFPCGDDQPLTSSLNYRAGVVAGNSGIVKLNDAGELCIFTFADTDLVIDVNAWLKSAPSFASLTPARLAETRSGEVTVDGEAQELGRLDAGSVTEVQIAGRGGVDAGADAVALNVTAIRPDGVGYVTLYPCDEDRPTTSSLNYSGGGAVGNSAVVSLSATGSLCVFTFADTDLVIDVNAWLADDASFDPFVPARFFETRSGQETVDGVGNGGGRLGAGSVTTIDVAGRGDVPADASAVALNVTAVRPDGVGYITLFPCDGDQPLTSSLNYAAGGAVGNSGIVKLAADGTVCAYSRAATDLVIDVNAAWAG